MKIFGVTMAVLALAVVGCGDSSGPGTGGTGTGGNAGATATAGTGGIAATGGTAGSTGAAGSGGTSGAAGTTATGGTTGTAGTTGTGGTTGTAGAGGTGGSAGAGGLEGASGAAAFKLTSPAFTEGMEIPAEYTCVSTNGAITSRPSPALSWGAGPPGTMGYAIVLRDSNNGFSHWAIWDIPASVLALPRDVSQTSHMPPDPAGSKQVGGNNESMGYIRPCPPSGSHVYAFTLYAQKALPLAGVTTAQSAGDLKTQLDKTANNLGTATLNGKCTR